MTWPQDTEGFRKAARDAFLTEAVNHTDYWIAHGKDLLINAEPSSPFRRSWSEAAKRDEAYRDVFQTLTERQRAKVIELLNDCVRGGIFSLLVTLDQFPGGEAQIHVWDGVCGEGKRKVMIAPSEVDLHDEFHDRLAGGRGLAG